MFRNEGMDTKHNPEFTMIEMYQAYTDYHGMMDLTEKIFEYVAKTVKGTTKITYQGTEIDLTPPWRRLSMTEAVKEYVGIDFDAGTDIEELRRKPRQRAWSSKAKYRGANCCTSASIRRSKRN